MPTKQESLLASKIGKRMREIRKQKKITLIDLSQNTDVAQATLSRMENGQMLGTVESHRKIAVALGVSLSYLYEGIDTRSESVKSQKASERKRVVLKSGEINQELLMPNISSKKIVPVLVTLSGGAKSSMDQAERGIEKFIWVLNGKIKIAFENTDYDLDQNDSLYFDASASHQYINTGSGEAKIMTVSSK